MLFESSGKKTLTWVLSLGVLASLLTYCKSQKSETSTPSSSGVALGTDLQQQLNDRIQKIDELLHSAPTVPTKDKEGNTDYGAQDYNKLVDTLKTFNQEQMKDLFNSPAFAGLTESYNQLKNQTPITVTNTVTSTETSTETSTSTTTDSKSSGYFSWMYSPSAPGTVQLSVMGTALFIGVAVYNAALALGADAPKAAQVWNDRKFFSGVVWMRTFVGLGLTVGNLIVAALGYTGDLTQEQYNDLTGAFAIIDGVTTMMVGAYPLIESEIIAPKMMKKKLDYGVRGNFADLFIDPRKYGTKYPSTVHNQEFWKEYYDIIEKVEIVEGTETDKNGYKKVTATCKPECTAAEKQRIKEMNSTGEINKAYEIHSETKKPTNTWKEYYYSKATKHPTMFSNPYKKLGPTNKNLMRAGMGAVVGFGAVVTAAGTAGLIIDHSHSNSTALAEGTNTSSDPRHVYFEQLGAEFQKLFELHNQIYAQ